MPKRAKIITYFREYTESKLSDAVSLIIDSLKTNAAYFEGLPVAVSKLKSQLKKFNKNRNSVIYDGQSADSKKARKIMQTSLKANGVWLNDSAYGNVSMLKKTGYPFHQKYESQGILPETTLKMSRTKSIGKLKFDISIIKIQNVKYGLMYTLATIQKKILRNGNLFIVPKKAEELKCQKVM